VLTDAQPTVKAANTSTQTVRSSYLAIIRVKMNHCIGNPAVLDPSRRCRRRRGGTRIRGFAPPTFVGFAFFDLSMI
jgi:hypothetical protein